jgi:inositol-phosphate phosphatase / L-galactose 1-phosphate phosphatase / histidinol-phosphatase
MTIPTSPQLAAFASGLVPEAFDRLAAGFDDLVARFHADATLRDIAQREGPAGVLRADLPAIEALQKQNRELVTTAESDAESLMRRIVLERFPDHAIEGEELGSTPGSDCVWVFDPVDGTSAMIRTAIAVAHNVPLEDPQPRFGISIAVLRNDQAIVGVVTELQARDGKLAMGPTWVGNSEGPTTRDGAPVTVPPPPPVDEAVLASTVPQVMFSTRETWSGFQALQEATASLVVDANCIGFVQMLDNTTHVVCERDMTLPDAASLVPILRGAGATVTDHNGKDVRFDRSAFTEEYCLLAAGQPLHTTALDILRRGVPDTRNRFAAPTDDHGYSKKFA